MGHQLTVTLLVCLLLAGTATSEAAGAAPESAATALARSLFGFETGPIPGAGLAAAEQARVDVYNRCRAHFVSQIPQRDLPDGPERWLTDKRREVERAIVCLLGTPGIADLASRYAREAELYYEWEGSSEGPLAEAAFARDYLAAHGDSPLRPFLHLFVAHRSRCAAEALAAEGNADGVQRATATYLAHREAAAGDRDPLVRLAAAGLAELPFVYFEPPESPAPLPDLAPLLSLQRALELAEVWVREQGLDTSGQYLSSVSPPLRRELAEAGPLLAHPVELDAASAGRRAVARCGHGRDGVRSPAGALSTLRGRA